MIYEKSTVKNWTSRNVTTKLIKDVGKLRGYPKSNGDVIFSFICAVLAEDTERLEEINIKIGGRSDLKKRKVVYNVYTESGYIILRTRGERG